MPNTYDDERNLLEFDYTFDTAKASSQVYIKCPHCLDVFKRRKADLVRNDNWSCRKCYLAHEAHLQMNRDKQKTNEARERSMLERYGVRNAMHTDIAKTNIRKTNQAKFGCDFGLQAPSVREKIRKTVKDKHGVDFITQAPLFKEKAKATCLARYGVENPLMCESVRAKVAATNKQKYGVTNPFSNEDVQEEARNTKLDKYGTLAPFVGKAEQAVREYVEQLTNEEFKPSAKVIPGRELDLFNKERALAIEYCGLVWHSSLFNKEPLKHYRKYRACLKQNVRLITIFEDEWVHRQKQVKSFLRSVLLKNKRKFFARKTDVRILDKADANAFIEEWHIQGKNNLGVWYAGLYNGDELLAVMSFGRHPRNRTDIVLDRLCFKEDVTVVGGASKLFQFLLKVSKATTVVSWSDNRWSAGEVYRQIGFTLDKEYRPDYSYVKNDHKILRYSKQSQKKSATKCPAHLTESEWAIERGLYKIYDCGKKKWTFKCPASTK